MSKDLVVQNFSDHDLQIIKDTVAKNATDEELKLFLARCKTLGLNPLRPGQIFFQKYKNKNTGDYYPGTIIVGRDGLRALAARTGKHRGTKTGTIKEGGKLTKGWAEVYRAGWDHPARVEVAFSEYNRNTDIWRDLPDTMIQKVAECAALRMAFPDELGGVYSEDERVVSEAEPKPEARSIELQVENFTDRPEFESILTHGGVAPPPAGEKAPEAVYVFKTGGTRKGKPLTAFSVERLNNFIADVDQMVADGKVVPDAVQEDYNATINYLMGQETEG